MLGIVAGVAAGLFVVVTTAVGVRMMLLARRTRGVPETLIGAGMTTIGLVGYPLGLAAGAGRGTMAEMNIPLWLLSIVAIDAGLLLIYAFTWRVFRPSSAWAKGLVVASGVYLVGVGLCQLLAFLNAPPDAPSGQVALRYTGAFLIGSAGCFLWSGIEGALQYRMARRRLAMGLADPVVANRFLLWAVFGASATLICAGSAVGLLRGVYSGASDEMKIVTGVFGVVGSGAMYLAFVPPAWYLRRVRARASA
jgi:hypothetical protein